MTMAVGRDSGLKNKLIKKEEKGAALSELWKKKKKQNVYLVCLFCTSELCVMDLSTCYTVVSVFNEQI